MPPSSKSMQVSSTPTPTTASSTTSPHNSNDTQAILRQWYRDYAPQVYRRCFYFLKNPDDAKDAMQDTFIKAAQNLATFRNEASPLTWLMRVASNHCLNIIRSKNAAWHDAYERDVKSQPEHIDSTEVLSADHQLMQFCLAKCPPDLVDIAVHYFVDEMKQSEIADAVGLSIPTVRKRLRSFIDICRQEISQRIPGATFAEPPV